MDISEPREKLVARAAPFLKQVQNLTPGVEVEEMLNSAYGPGTPLYDDLAHMIIAGVRDGWAANQEVDGLRYRRSRLCDPCERTSYFSITTVYMDSLSSGRADDQTYRGDYHAHPYGELNMVVPLDRGAEIGGPLGWRGAGWTAPAPGSHHYPEVRGGSVIALFFLPAGRISYDINPPRADI